MPPFSQANVGIHSKLTDEVRDVEKGRQDCTFLRVAQLADEG